MKNNKGFSLVELLAVIAIMGILFGIGLQAYQRYTAKAYDDSMNFLAESSKAAAESYIADYPGETEVDLDTLVRYNYLENNKDPKDKTTPCSGKVRITIEPSDDPDAIDKYSYAVDLCCISGSYRYDEKGTRVKTSICGADGAEDELIETNSANCTAARTRTVTINIYAMNYLGKTCTKNESGVYENCKDAGGNNPCRRYDYHSRKCNCVYNKQNGNKKFCSSSVTASGAEDYEMKIRYFDNAKGTESCSSETSSDINSYVEKVGNTGTSGSDAIELYGYQFFRGQSSNYTNFNPEGTWFHDPITGVTLEDRVQRISKSDGTIDYEQGCRATCVRFTKYLNP